MSFNGALFNDAGPDSSGFDAWQILLNSTGAIVASGNALEPIPPNVLQPGHRYTIEYLHCNEVIQSLALPTPEAVAYDLMGA